MKYPWIILLATLIAAGCKNATSMSCIGIRSQMEGIVNVSNVCGVDFHPYPNPSEPTNSRITGAVSKAKATHCSLSRIVVSDTITITYREKDGSSHTPRVTIVGTIPGKKDYGDVEIVIRSPNEAVVTVGERVEMAQ